MPRTFTPKMRSACSRRSMQTGGMVYIRWKTARHDEVILARNVADGTRHDRRDHAAVLRPVRGILSPVRGERRLRHLRLRSVSAARLGAPQPPRDPGGL